MNSLFWDFSQKKENTIDIKRDFLLKKLRVYENTVINNNAGLQHVKYFVEFFLRELDRDIPNPDLLEKQGKSLKETLERISKETMPYVYKIDLYSHNSISTKFNSDFQKMMNLFQDISTLFNNNQNFEDSKTNARDYLLQIKEIVEDMQNMNHEFVLTAKKEFKKYFWIGV